ncbi:hypothetical protein F4811DRAFT_491640 [Daldinia bambusicola]|nr:hypothetical protein F4811DRAFT_491640 [Daldinia bambusicola]
MHLNLKMEKSTYLETSRENVRRSCTQCYKYLLQRVLIPAAPFTFFITSPSKFVSCSYLICIYSIKPVTYYIFNTLCHALATSALLGIVIRSQKKQGKHNNSLFRTREKKTFHSHEKPISPKGQKANTNKCVNTNSDLSKLLAAGLTT